MAAAFQAKQRQARVLELRLASPVDVETINIDLQGWNRDQCIMCRVPTVVSIYGSSR